MTKIKIVMHSKTVGYSGTDRVCQLFAKYLDKDRFDPFIVYRDNDSSNTRLDVVKQWLGDEHVVPYNWNPGKRGRQTPFLPEEDNLFDVLDQIKPQIVHLHRGGASEWPGFKWLSPQSKFVETNIFGFNDLWPVRQFDAHIYICEYIRNTAAKTHGFVDGPVIYNPIEMPLIGGKLIDLSRQALLGDFDLPPDSILLGRIGRPDNFDPISLNAFREIEKKYPNAYYLVVNPCQGWRDTSQSLGLRNVRFLEPIIDDIALSMFYSGIDIFAHARSDGECNGVAIGEAMMHGLPVVSHESVTYNGQKESLQDCGFVVPLNDWKAYRDVLDDLVSSSTIRQHFGDLARARAMANFEASLVTKQLEKVYEDIINENSNK